MKNNEDGNIQKLEKLLTSEEINYSNNISKITDKIYLGDEEGAKELDFFKTEGIHYILSIVKIPPTYPDNMNMKVLHLNMGESLTTNIISFIKQSINFIEKADKIYIHCTCGINRSAAILIGYLMWKTHSSFDDVFNYVKKRRDCIEPINPFIIQLHKFENLLKQNNYDHEKVIVNARTK